MIGSTVCNMLQLFILSIYMIKGMNRTGTCFLRNLQPEQIELRPQVVIWFSAGVSQTII